MSPSIAAEMIFHWLTVGFLCCSSSSGVVDSPRFDLVIGDAARCAGGEISSSSKDVLLPTTGQGEPQVASKRRKQVRRKSKAATTGESRRARLCLECGAGARREGNR